MKILAVAALAALALAAPAAAAPDFADRQDFTFADHGFLGTRTDPKIVTADGRVAWDLSAYDFLKGPAPADAGECGGHGRDPASRGTP